MGNKIAVRVKPLKQWSDVSNATRHGKREDPSKHVDRSRTHLNKHWLSMDIENPDGSVGRKVMPTEQPVDIAAAFKDLADKRGAKWRKNAIVGTEMLFIASPDFFGAAGPQREKLANEWALKCITAAIKKYPGQVAAARLDLDETTPHLSVFLIPTYQKSYDGEKRQSSRKPKRTISHNQVFGTPEKLSALQDWAAAEMKAAGYKLERGEPKIKKGPDHNTPAEGRRRLQQVDEQAEHTLAGARSAAERIIADAEGEAAKIIEKATPERFLSLQSENEALKRENEEFRDYLTDWIAKYEILKKMVDRFTPPNILPDMQAAFRNLWKAYPKSEATLRATEAEQRLDNSSSSLGMN